MKIIKSVSFDGSTLLDAGRSEQPKPEAIERTVQAVCSPRVSFRTGSKQHNLHVLRYAIHSQLPVEWLERWDSAFRIHLAIMSAPFDELILTGKKKIESRFSCNRSRAWSNVYAGDIVVMKQSGGPIVGLFVVSKADRYTSTPTVSNWWSLRTSYSERICATDAFWESVAHRNFAILMWVGAHHRLQTPVELERAKGDRSGWMLLSSRVEK